VQIEGTLAKRYGRSQRRLFSQFGSFTGLSEILISEFFYNSRYSSLIFDVPYLTSNILCLLFCVLRGLSAHGGIQSLQMFKVLVYSLNESLVYRIRFSSSLVSFRDVQTYEVS